MVVSGIEESFKASKYPMSVDTENCTSDVTQTIRNLGSCSGGHDQFLTGILVSFDLTFSNKAWVEAERYRFLNFVSSQSTMHRISKMDIKSQCNEYVDDRIINVVRELKDKYLSTNDTEDFLKLIYNIPSGFELTARLTTNYRCLKNIWQQRHTHRLPEWRKLCEWIETLPHFKEICLNKEVKDNE